MDASGRRWFPSWLALSLATAALWGVWGALIEFPEKHFQPGFPATLGYIVWSLTMIPCAAVALFRNWWRLQTNPRAVAYGLATGLCGSAGQLALFLALKSGPAYLIFPIISLSPLLSIALAAAILRERTNEVAWTGIGLALAAIPLLSIQRPEAGQTVSSYGWLAGTVLAFAAWGVQAFLWKASAGALDEESLFAYMAIAAVVLAPFAWKLTDFSAPINWDITGPGLTGAIQLLNSVGALLVIYAVRAGKAIIVVPAINGLYPLIAIVLSFALYARWPEPWTAVGMVLAVAAIVLMSVGETL